MFTAITTTGLKRVRFSEKIGVLLVPDRTDLTPIKSTLYWDAATIQTNQAASREEIIQYSKTYRCSFEQAKHRVYKS
jgi:hypothetical protein